MENHAFSRYMLQQLVFYGQSHFLKYVSQNFRYYGQSGFFTIHFAIFVEWPPRFFKIHVAMISVLCKIMLSQHICCNILSIRDTHAFSRYMLQYLVYFEQICVHKIHLQFLVYHGPSSFLKKYVAIHEDFMDNHAFSEYMLQFMRIIMDNHDFARNIWQ